MWGGALGGWVLWRGWVRGEGDVNVNSGEEVPQSWRVFEVE